MFSLQRCLRDILDGFFPSELQRLYPDGVPFKVTTPPCLGLEGPRNQQLPQASAILMGEPETRLPREVVPSAGTQEEGPALVLGPPARHLASLGFLRSLS